MSGHAVTVIRAVELGKLDAGALVVAVCSCGNYQSAPATTREAERRGSEHIAAQEQWGVMFRDGSVRHPWNGRTQRRRAEEELARLLEEQRTWLDKRGLDRQPDDLRLAWRPSRDDPTWRVVE